MDNNQNNYNNPYGEPSQNNYYQPVQPQAAPQAGRTPVVVKVLSIVSMVCGIFGLVFCWYPFGVFGLFSIGALVTSTIGNNKACGGFFGKFTSMNKAGKITGIIGIIINVIALVIWVALMMRGDYSYL